MKGLFSLSLICLAAGALRSNLSPVSRCVQLLQNLGKEIEKETKKEEDLFETFVCWGKAVIATKTASNSAAESRIDMLKNYIADIAAGRIEFTSERQDLEKEIEENLADITELSAVRSQENKDFRDAKDEMVKAIRALDGAIKVLGTATKDHKTGVLFALKSSVNEGYSARAAEGALLNHAVELGEKFLTKGDSVFLRRLLTGDVPKPDWKKLNRKATFKMKYKGRSLKLQEVLGKLRNTFKANLKAAEKTEAKEAATFEKLKAGKTAQLEKAQTALGKMESEMGARGMSKADSEKEVAALEEQVKNDKKFIADTTKAVETKTKEWEARSALRAGELKAISEAVATLNSDDARDNFKKSYASQGFFFLQESSRSALVARATEQIQDLSVRVDDYRLVELAGNITAGTHFKEVITAIDNMVKLLVREEAKDLATKQDCEKNRMADSRDAIEAGRAIDDMTDAITKLEADIKDLSDEKKTTEAELKDARAEMAEAKKQRGEENAEWQVSDADDKAASETIGMAKDTLVKFYKDNNLMLVQKQPQAPAGEAPIPPPPTWEGEYKGKVESAGGILGILKMIQEDVDKDRAAAKAAEDEAQGAYDKVKATFKEQEKNLLKAIADLEGKIGAKETKMGDTKKERLTKKGEMDATVKKIQNADPGCDYIEVNYPLRVKNRQTEIDGLVKAKAILSGGSFTKPADNTREIKPGDALLQRSRRH